MGKFDLDIMDVAKVVCPDNNKFPIRGNENKIIRVAFDLFRLKGDETETLWKVQADDDGNEFLVRTYDLPEETETQKTANWKILPDKENTTLTVIYENVPIGKIAGKDYNATSVEEVDMLRKTLLSKFSSDEQFVQKYLGSLPTGKQAILKEHFGPEFIKKASKNDPLGLGKVLRFDKKRHDKLDKKEEKELIRHFEEYINKEKSEKEQKNKSTRPLGNNADDHDTEEKQKIEKLKKIQRKLYKKLDRGYATDYARHDIMGAIEGIQRIIDDFYFYEREELDFDAPIQSAEDYDQANEEELREILNDLIRALDEAEDEVQIKGKGRDKRLERTRLLEEEIKKVHERLEYLKGENGYLSEYPEIDFENPSFQDLEMEQDAEDDKNCGWCNAPGPHRRGYCYNCGKTLVQKDAEEATEEDVDSCYWCNTPGPFEKGFCHNCGKKASDPDALDSFPELKYEDDEYIENFYKNDIDKLNRKSNIKFLLSKRAEELITEFDMEELDQDIIDALEKADQD